jgi:hypothetical protein
MLADRVAGAGHGAGDNDFWIQRLSPSSFAKSLRHSDRPRKDSRRPEPCSIAVRQSQKLLAQTGQALLRPGRADRSGATLSLLRAPHKKGDAAEAKAAASFGSGS